MLSNLRASGQATTCASHTSSYYRRNTATKAPRKRCFLVRVQSRAPRSEAFLGSVQPGGGNGPNGPKDGKVCCWGGDNGGDNGAPGSMGLFAFAGAAAIGVAVCTHANPANAAAVVDSDVLFSSSLGEIGSFYPSSDVADVDVWEASNTTTNAAGIFTEEEKELVVPKQYRVREWVYVH